MFLDAGELKQVRYREHSLDTWGRAERKKWDIPRCSPSAKKLSSPMFPELQIALRDNARAGSLEVQDNVLTRVNLFEALLVFAELGPAKLRLCELLVRTGVVTDKQCVQVREAMTKARLALEDVLIGEGIVSLGILDTAKVYWAKHPKLLQDPETIRAVPQHDARHDSNVQHSPKTSRSGSQRCHRIRIVKQ